MFRWSSIDVSTSGEGVGPQVNKFEQVSTDVSSMRGVGVGPISGIGKEGTFVPMNHG